MASAFNFARCLQNVRCRNLAISRLSATLSPKRLYSSNVCILSEQDLWHEYNEVKGFCETYASKHDINVNSAMIFANNEMNLSDIQVYGFDYDYTLACYKDALHRLIYDQALENLVGEKKFPAGIKGMPYRPEFGIRGLHFDRRKGVLMKLDTFNSIQMGTVHRGLNQLSDKEVVELYGGTHIPDDHLKPDKDDFHISQLMDLFNIPEMTLLCNVIQYLIDHEIDYDPEYLFNDIRKSVKDVHIFGTMHREVANNVEKYLDADKQVAKLINKLHSSGKNLFLITNSPFWFVDKGMQFLIGPDWTDMFDVIVSNARKPLFFKDQSRPFRFIYPKTGTPAWSRVTKLQKGKIYIEGNVQQFTKMTSWDPSQVLYFGDHVYSDLADPGLKNGWRTGGVIPELADEITICNSVPFKRAVTWLVALQDLIEKHQVHNNAACQAVVQEWLNERQQLRVTTKTLFNPQFGSIFRTYHNPSYFVTRLCRFADVYTSSVCNLLDYSLTHTFYPRRSALPHEISYSALSAISASRKISS
ncbi:5'-nucleotidase domain-containing protein 3-like [Amphiura filiformis]|uniref:5'-nucleotidase domain-containing protein 3-like n=1 Tax=Amphiura filiformis TaxID=82378 RepID=UPI003B213DA2